MPFMLYPLVISYFKSHRTSNHCGSFIWISCESFKSAIISGACPSTKLFKYFFFFQYPRRHCCNVRHIQNCRKAFCHFPGWPSKRFKLMFGSFISFDQLFELSDFLDPGFALKWIEKLLAFSSSACSSSWLSSWSIRILKIFSSKVLILSNFSTNCHVKQKFQQNHFER